MLVASWRNRGVSIGSPRCRSSGSPPGSSRTSIVRPRSRTNSSGRTAHAASRWSFRPYSCASRSTVTVVGRSVAGSTTMYVCRSPPGPRRQALQKTRSSSFHRTCGGFSSPSATAHGNGLIGRPPQSDRPQSDRRPPEMRQAWLARAGLCRTAPGSSARLPRCVDSAASARCATGRDENLPYRPPSQV